MTEGDIMRSIQREVSRLGGRVFRNNVGRFRLEGGRWFHAGLTVGSSDLIGMTADGRFLAIEVKTARGRVTEEQQKFIDFVNHMGGVAFVARSVRDLCQLNGTSENCAAT